MGKTVVIKWCSGKWQNNESSCTISKENVNQVNIYRQSIHQYVKSAVIHYVFDVFTQKTADENRSDFLKLLFFISFQQKQNLERCYFAIVVVVL